ncbi:hypothetical protein IW261DRAFT_1426564 [Armillaria novae-zelandiae]|uniref:Uncharacterized protein n=1 Tax=Armillaria novae-zelandiae TaxID=153914 RepID=A0AA39NKU7_9AGAR|nr:hypothetical protein IW261DRAFT_1426564 [Armillaria novae-zelandiae]
MQHGSHSGKHDAVLVADKLPLDVESKDEGLKVFVQTGTCRCQVWGKIFSTKLPQLLKKTWPGPAPKSQRQTRVHRGEPHLPTQSSLYKWRTTIKKRDFPGALFGASAILKDETIKLLSSLGSFPSEESLERIMKEQWSWYDRYGKELYVYLQSLNLPPLMKKLRKARTTTGQSAPAPGATKRSIEEDLEVHRKRRRVEEVPESGHSAETEVVEHRVMMGREMDLGRVNALPSGAIPLLPRCININPASHHFDHHTRPSSTGIITPTPTHPLSNINLSSRSARPQAVPMQQGYYHPRTQVLSTPMPIHQHQMASEPLLQSGSLHSTLPVTFLQPFYYNPYMYYPYTHHAGQNYPYPAPGQ